MAHPLRDSFASSSTTTSESVVQEEHDDGRRTFDSQVLCLHYYSNALSFEFGDHDDVYRIDQIEEWAKLEDPVWLERLKLQLFQVAGKAGQSLLIHSGRAHTS